MLCTVVWDAYGWDDRTAVWNALKELLPADGDHWSRKGLYVYWDPETHEMLYTGLATNLPKRFAQHNGLVRHAGGNKLAKITEWFQGHGRLGFSVMLQAAGVELQDQIHETSPSIGGTSDDIIKAAEGQVIELHRVERGTWPPWNGVGGSTRGQEWATGEGRTVVKILTAETDSLFVARSALRDLAADQTAQAHEVTIHGGRIHALRVSHELADLPRQMAQKTSQEQMEFVRRLFMIKSGHLIDDLSASDGEIIDRLRQLEDGRVLSEYRAMQADLMEMIPEMQDAGDREIAMVQFISAVQAQAEHPLRAAEVTELFRSGYLSQRPQLGPDLAT